MTELTPKTKTNTKPKMYFLFRRMHVGHYLQAQSQTTRQLAKFVDDAMDAIEKENPSLKGVLPKVFARQNLDPTSLGGLIDLVGNIALVMQKHRSADVLGHVF